MGNIHCNRDLLSINSNHFENCFRYDANYRVLSALRNSGHLIVDGHIDKSMVANLDDSRIPEKYVPTYIKCAY